MSAAPPRLDGATTEIVAFATFVVLVIGLGVAFPALWTGEADAAVASDGAADDDGATLVDTQAPPYR